MKQRGVYEKVPGSEIRWIRYVDADGRYRREEGPTPATLGYGLAVFGGNGGAGLANLAASIATLGRTSLNA